MATGRARTMGLGSYPKVPLAKAREKAQDAHSRLVDDVDPIDAREALRAAQRAERATRLTFKEAAEKYIRSKQDGWKNEKHRKQWSATLETYAYPLIGKSRVAEISNADVLRVLQQEVALGDKQERLWTAHPETAKRLRGRIEAVLSWATAGGFRSGENPAAWSILKYQLPKKEALARGKVKHHAALAIDDVPAFLARLRTVEGMSAKALEFVLFTAARTGEVRGATWREMDLEAKVWTVPAERMKAGKEHRVPLSEPALAVLKPLHELRASDDAFVFPSHSGGQLSDMALPMTMRRMDVGAVPHGLRSTFRDWGGDRTTFPRDLLEKALAHTLDDKTEASYARSDMLEKRRDLMEAWATFCEGKAGGNVRLLVA